MDSGGPPGRLRGELTEFVGRRAQLALARQALAASRLVTLTGLGVIGKTRLALLVPEVARSPGPSDQPGHWLPVPDQCEHAAEHRDRQAAVPPETRNER